MSYLRKIEYKIIPEGSFKIIRNCSVCKCKSTFVNSNHFRVNANGNRIDVWLIYQCKKCNHTYNMTIYERLEADHLPANQYKNFLENDNKLARKYGTDKAFFVKNKAEIDWSSMKYQIVNIETQGIVTNEQINFKSGDLIQIGNPYGLKIRADKIIADLLDITHHKAKQLLEKGSIKRVKNNFFQNIDLMNHEDICTK